MARERGGFLGFKQGLQQWQQLIFDPPAVGKMAVGLELERLTGLRFFHNHVTVNQIIQLFPFESGRYRRLVTEFRQRIFKKSPRAAPGG